MLDREIRSLIENQKLLHMAAGATVSDAAARMADAHVGAMLVCDGTDTVGASLPSATLWFASSRCLIPAPRAWARMTPIRPR